MGEHAVDRLVVVFVAWRTLPQLLSLLFAFQQPGFTSYAPTGLHNTEQHVACTLVCCVGHTTSFHTLTTSHTGHCKRLAPTWKEMAEDYASSSKIAIAHVDCTTDREVCTTAEIKVRAGISTGLNQRMEVQRIQTTSQPQPPDV